MDHATRNLTDDELESWADSPNLTPDFIVEHERQTPPSTDIVLADQSGLPDIETVADAVAQLVDEGDEDALRDARSQAEAYSLYQERNKNLEQANHFARLKLLTEAGIGEISLRQSPKLPRHAPGVDGQPTQPNSITSWRQLAIAHQRDAMLGICDEVAESGEMITTTRVVRICEKRGWGRVPASALAKAIEALCKKKGISRYELARESGLYSTTFYQANRQATWVWPTAVRVATIVGIDPLKLPPSPPKRKTTSSKAWWLTRERKRTGGKWDKAYGHFRQCLGEFQALAPNNESKWDEAYQHFYAIEQLIGRQMLKERSS